ncbi:hypothetical protein FTO70_16120 [Methanosarcina sp. KYL-1]|uniref:hypothetical protein n=1 Tax=Methanosarcina sp. KYL-1 TaxID=2602068 RepID=UPI0021006AAB|nr:hypothetical protein [Methanosarcina sp. KYL-1]MCQ1537173.1 hypothetical protein [Methanosarcina sp. KYL-1]
MILRFCLETNGNANPKILENFAELGLRSGGNIKFDLKFRDENLNRAITGIGNKPVHGNFKRKGKYYGQRREVPFLTAATLMVPGYTSRRSEG